MPASNVFAFIFIRFDPHFFRDFVVLCWSKNGCAFCNQFMIFTSTFNGLAAKFTIFPAKSPIFQAIKQRYYSVFARSETKKSAIFSIK